MSSLYIPCNLQCRQFYCFLSELDFFIFFLIALARNSNTMLNRNDKSEHLCLVFELREKAFSSSSLSIKFLVGLSLWPLLYWGVIPSIRDSLTSFNHDAEFHQMLFFTSIEIIIQFYPHFANMVYCMIYRFESSLQIQWSLQIWIHHQWINATWSWYKIL